MFKLSSRNLSDMTSAMNRIGKEYKVTAPYRYETTVSTVVKKRRQGLLGWILPKERTNCNLKFHQGQLHEVEYGDTFKRYFHVDEPLTKNGQEIPNTKGQGTSGLCIQQFKTKQDPYGTGVPDKETIIGYPRLNEQDKGFKTPIIKIDTWSMNPNNAQQNLTRAIYLPKK